MEGALLRMSEGVRAQIAAAWSPRVLRIGPPTAAPTDTLQRILELGDRTASHTLVSRASLRSVAFGH